MQSRHSKLYCLCSRDIQNFIVCAVATFKTLLFVQSRHLKLYCLCSRDIQNFIVCAVATFKTLLFVQSRHSKLYCLCSRDIQNFIVCAVATFKTLLFVQSRHSKLYCLCSRAIRNFLVCVSLLGLRSKRSFQQERFQLKNHLKTKGIVKYIKQTKLGIASKYEDQHRQRPFEKFEGRSYICCNL